MILLLLSPFLAVPALSQPSLPTIAERDSIPLPDSFERVEFHLLTVGRGNHVWDNFGHTALRVVDEVNDTDLVFNWGMFDTSVGLARFSFDFMRGIMDYRLGVYPTAMELARYEREQRTVWQDRINLNAAQKERLYQRLSWNLRRDNIGYAYDYFFDNCTTRVRDYLDEALMGSIYEETRRPVADTFRDQVLAHYDSLPPVALSLDVLLNSRVDQRMTMWQEMFLPLYLREHLRSLPSDVSEGGRTLDLLSDEQVLMRFPSPEPEPDGYHFFAGLLLPLFFLLASLRRVSIASLSSSPGYSFNMPGFSYRLLGLIGLLLALFSSLLGMVMIFGWTASTHLDLHHNINLLLFWPTDILGAFIALWWLFSGGPLMLGSGKYQLIAFYMLLHVLAALVYLLIGMFGLTEQRITSLMLYVVPVLLLFAMLVLAAGLRPVRAIRFN